MFFKRKVCVKANFTNFVFIFGYFLVLCDIVSNISTIFFRVLEVCLERYDLYGNVGFFKKSNNFIFRNFFKRNYCPPIGTLDMLLFIMKSTPTL